MNTRHGTLAILAVLTLATAGDLFAQRRGSSGGGSSGRSAPSGGGRSSGSGGSRRSSGSSHSSGSSRGSSGSQSSGSRGSAQPSAGGQTSTNRTARGTSPGTLPATGKIGAIKRNARAVSAATHSGGGVYYGGGVYIGACLGCGYWGYYGPAWGYYDNGWWYPANHAYDHVHDYPEDNGGNGESTETPANMEHVDLGQGYMPYPYAENDGTGETFVRERTSQRHSYGALTLGYFKDEGSTTQAGHVQFETAVRSFHFDMGYDQYVEPVLGHTDRLHTGRFSIGAQPAVGKHAYIVAGIGARGVWLNDGQDAYGPEGTLGLQILPFKPIGLNVTGRLATVSWTGHDWNTMTEINTTGSLFLGHLEVMGGWHWMQMQGSPGFGGPLVGTRLWF